MKKLLLTSALSLATVAVFGQGVISFGNNFGKTVSQDPIYGPDPGSNSVAIVGNSSLSVPAGTTVYTGPLLQGTGYEMVFYAGPTTAASVSGMAMITSIIGFQTAAGNVKPAGLLPAVYAPTTGVTGTTDGGASIAVAGGNNISEQMFVWQSTADNVAGAPFPTPANETQALADYEAGGFLYGAGPVFTTGPLVSPPATPGNAVGGASFNVSELPVASSPEPGTLALVGLGACGMLLIRRKK